MKTFSILYKMMTEHIITIPAKSKEDAIKRLKEVHEDAVIKEVVDSSQRWSS